MRVLSRQEPGRLLARTVAVPDPEDLLGRLPQPDVLAWVHHGAGLAGWGEAVRVTLPAGEDRFTAGEKWLRSVFDAADIDDQVRVRGSGPIAFGSFTFDASSDGSALIVPRIVLGRDGRGRAWLTSVSPGGRPPSPPRSWGEPSPRPPLGPPPILGDLSPRPPPGPQGGRACGGRRQPVGTALGAGGGRCGGGDQGRQPAEGGAGPGCLRYRRRAHRHPGPAAQARRPLSGLLHLRLRRHGRRDPGTARPAGRPPRSARWCSAARPRAAATRRRTRRWARNCWPRRRTSRNTPTRSPRSATGWGRCATRSTVEPRPSLLKLPNLQHLGTHIRGTLTGNGTPKSVLALAAAVHPPAAVCGHPDRRRPWNSSASSSTWTGSVTPGRSAG